MKAQVRQLGLDLPVEPRFGRDDFLASPSNEAALSRIEAWPEWPDRVLLIVGPKGAGKSHLGAIWAERSGARILASAELRGEDLPTFASAPLLVEDADLQPLREAELFHLLNLVRAGSGWLVITAQDQPDHWGLATRDLLSRLRLAPLVGLGAPDDALVRAVMVKLFHDRQIEVDTSVVDYLALRIDRSLAATRDIVDRLDREALARGRAVTRPMAVEVLRSLDSGT